MWQIAVVAVLAILAIANWGRDDGFNFALPNVDFQRQFAAFQQEVSEIFESNPTISQQAPPAPQQVSVSEDWENPLFANPESQIPTRLDAVPFGQCVKMIEQTAGTIGRGITILEEGSERRVVALHTGEGDLVLTCADGAMTMEQRRAAQP
jgi:hypothetical protein